AEGKTKQQAVVCLMRKLVNIIYAMMKTKSAYVMPSTPVRQSRMIEWVVIGSVFSVATFFVQSSVL
ncbi:hypothetical protein, partial [Paenibacillus durus]